MKIINNSINFKSFTVIGFISILIFIFKWFFSYYFFKDDLSIKIIFDSPSDGFFYYVYLEALSSLNFNNSFDVNIDRSLLDGLSFSTPKRFEQFAFGEADKQLNYRNKQYLIEYFLQLFFSNAAASLAPESVAAAAAAAAA